MTIDEAIQILNLYDLGNMFLDVDGNPIGYEKMSGACDMAVEALRLSDRLKKRVEELEGKLEKNLSLSEATEFHALSKLLKEEWQNMTEWQEREVVSVKESGIEEVQIAKCPFCQKWHTTPYMYRFTEYPFCPNCGARMEGNG